MTRYETSPEVRPLEKTICEFAGLNGYDPMNVFTDFLVTSYTDSHRALLR